MSERDKYMRKMRLAYILGMMVNEVEENSAFKELPVNIKFLVNAINDTNNNFYDAYRVGKVTVEELIDVAKDCGIKFDSEGFMIEECEEKVAESTPKKFDFVV